MDGRQELSSEATLDTRLSNTPPVGSIVLPCKIALPMGSWQAGWLPLDCYSSLLGGARSEVGVPGTKYRWLQSTPIHPSPHIQRPFMQRPLLLQ
mmetsp:Transcript_58359/g.180743  ORF Transcript_58359/g.180743 Transcript_58359/m.180743 type:complete len:94 (+) Transcript_58359:363-644(+)